MEEINRIIKFLHRNPLTTWFNLSLKNFVFDTFTYLEEPFQPPRIFKTKAHNILLSHFYWDNEVYYVQDNGDSTTSLIDFKQLSSTNIPSCLAWISHYAWLNDERSRKKIAYQKARGWKCSYDWEEEVGLVFNLDYYGGAKHFPHISSTLKAAD